MGASECQLRLFRRWRITIFFGVFMGALLGWIAFKLIAGAFRADHANAA